MYKKIDISDALVLLVSCVILFIVSYILYVKFFLIHEIECTKIKKINKIISIHQDIDNKNDNYLALNDLIDKCNSQGLDKVSGSEEDESRIKKIDEMLKKNSAFKINTPEEIIKYTSKKLNVSGDGINAFIDNYSNDIKNSFSSIFMDKDSKLFMPYRRVYYDNQNQCNFYEDQIMHDPVSENIYKFIICTKNKGKDCISEISFSSPKRKNFGSKGNAQEAANAFLESLNKIIKKQDYEFVIPKNEDIERSFFTELGIEDLRCSTNTGGKCYFQKGENESNHYLYLIRRKKYVRNNQGC